ncbi:MAG: histidine kinase [Bacteroidota bacterium]
MSQGKYIPGEFEYVKNLYQDRNGFIWICSLSGLYKWDGIELLKIPDSNPKQGMMSTDLVNNIYQDASLKYWLSSDKMGIIYRFNPINDSLDIINIRNMNLVEQRVHWFSNFLEYENHIWIGGHTGLHQVNKNTLEVKIYQPRDDINLKQYLRGGNQIVDLVKDQQNENLIWCASADGLHSFDIADEKFTHHKMKNIFVEDKFKQDGNADCLVSSIVQFGDTLYCGTWASGMVSYNINTKEWMQHLPYPYTTAKTHDENIISGLTALNDSIIFGIDLLKKPYVLKFNRYQKSFTQYDKEDVKDLSGRTSEALLIDYNKNVWLASDERVMNFIPSKKQNQHQQVYVKQVAIDGYNIQDPDLHFNKSIVLDKGSYTMDLKYGLTYPNDSKNVTYEYKLQGYNKQWLDNKHSTSLSFENLSGGDYELKIRARENEKADWIYNKPIPIIIEKRIVDKVWFYPLLAFGALGIFFLGYSIYQKRKREEAKMISDYENRLLQLEMQSLRSQMNPHFMFNSLNSINQYIINSEPKTASRYLTRFSKLMRLILNNSKNKTVLLKDELEMLALYAEMESYRFEDKFDFEIELGNINTNELYIPPMIIQPYIENAIWHGLMRLKERKGHIVLKIEQCDEMLCCTIEDNGIGRQAALAHKQQSKMARKSMGMNITQNRMELVNKLFNTTSEIKIIDKTNNANQGIGTIVKIKLPLIKKQIL